MLWGQGLWDRPFLPHPWGMKGQWTQWGPQQGSQVTSGGRFPARFWRAQRVAPPRSPRCRACPSRACSGLSAPGASSGTEVRPACDAPRTCSSWRERRGLRLGQGCPKDQVVSWGLSHFRIWLTDLSNHSRMRLYTKPRLLSNRWNEKAGFRWNKEISGSKKLSVYDFENRTE